MAAVWISGCLRHKSSMVGFGLGAALRRSAGQYSSPDSWLFLCL